MGLVPVDVPRIIENLRAAIYALRALGKVESLYPKNPMGVIPIDEIHEAIFDREWEDLRIARRRLSILLNDGDTEILDCDYRTRGILESLWFWLEECRIEKPEFVPGGPQFLAEFSEYKEYFGEGFLVMLGALPEEDAPEDSIIDKQDLEPSYLPKQLMMELKISDKTLSGYAKAAVGVETPGRGKRNHRYSKADRETIYRHVMSCGGDAETVSRARSMVKDIERNRMKTENKPENRK